MTRALRDGRCYVRYKNRGTLDKARRETAGQQRSCTYEYCKMPNVGSQFYQIEAGRCSGMPSHAREDRGFPGYTQSHEGENRCTEID